MTEFTLSGEDISILKSAHRAARKERDAYRINAIVLLGTGWTIREVADALFLDDETFDEFRKTCKSFFRRIKRYKEDLTSLLTENFQIISSNT